MKSTEKRRGKVIIGNFVCLIHYSFMILKHNSCHYYARYHVLMKFLYLSYYIVHKPNYINCLSFYAYLTLELFQGQIKMV